MLEALTSDGDFANKRVRKITVTGHSLGGAMVREHTMCVVWIRHLDAARLLERLQLCHIWKDVTLSLCRFLQAMLAACDIGEWMKTNQDASACRQTDGQTSGAADAPSATQPLLRQAEEGGAEPQVLMQF